jgi:hypothetical protein
MHECGNLKNEHFNSVLERKKLGRAVSFLGIHQIGPDIILDSHRPSFNLQCTGFGPQKYPALGMSPGGIGAATVDLQWLHHKMVFS